MVLTVDRLNLGLRHVDVLFWLLNTMLCYLPDPVNVFKT